MRQIVHCVTWLCCLLLAAPAMAAEGEVVIENDHARIVVYPEAGAAITSYVDKRNNVDFIAGEAQVGKPYHAWKNITRLHPQDPPDNWVGAHPYDVKVDGNTITATNEAQWLRTQRVMTLAEDSTELTVVITQTNMSDEPQSLWARWHPYMKIDDPYAEHSVVLAPGPEPLTVRSVRLGIGYESHFTDVPGYWIAGNPTTGVGMWMTFDVGELIEAATWTGTRFNRDPRRGWFVAELYPKPLRLAPGESKVTKFTYQPYIAGDALSMGFVADEHRAAAERFAQLTRANLRNVAEHTMVGHSSGKEQVEAENRFSFSHRRRDRFVMTDWGIFDAMMSVPGMQTETVRLRLFADMFDSTGEEKRVNYQLTVTDALGKQAIKQNWAGIMDTMRLRAIDQRRDVALTDLPDGWYTFTLEAKEHGAEAVQHQVVEQVKLAQHAREAATAAREQRDASPVIERERPVVEALRTMDLQAGVVPIAVEEASGVDRAAWPVRTGVPFAQGALHRGGAVMVTAPDGKTVPIQTTETSHWLDGSVRWLLVEFAADVKANSFAMYNLKVGGEGNANAPIAVQSGDTLTIDGKWTIDTAGDAALLGLINADDVWWETTDGKRYTFRLEGDGAGIDLESNGPRRAVVRVVGWYFADGAAKPIARGEFRAEFIKDQPWWRLYHTYTYAGDPWVDRLASMGVTFALPDRAYVAGDYELDGKTVRATTLKQINEDIAMADAAQGSRATGAVALKTADGNAAAIYHRGLWRMHPKRIDAYPTENRVAFHYWPAGAGEFSWEPNEDIMHSSSSSPQELAVGASRTHEFIIDPDASVALTQYDETFDEPVLAIVAPRYVCATGAIPGLRPYDPVNLPLVERAIIEMTDSYALHRDVFGFYGQWRYGTLPNFWDHQRERWRTYGRYGNILNEQNIAHAPWLAYLRSGDRRHFKFAESFTRHLMEVGTIRLHPTWPTSEGMSRRHHEVPWLGGADHGHSMLDPFLEWYHVTGHTPAREAAVRMAGGMAEQRSGSWRYISNPVIGLTRMYTETGEQHYLDDANRIWRDLCYPEQNTWWASDHGSRMVRIYSDFNEDCRRFWLEWTDSKPGAFQSLDALSDLYRQTGDEKYAIKVADITDQYIKDIAGYDPRREDAAFYSISIITQYALQRMREWTYAGDVILAGRAARERAAKTE